MLKSVIGRFLFGEPIEKLYYRALKYTKKGRFFNYVAIYFIKKINRKFSCYLSAKASVGEGIKFPHPVGVVIGDGVVISERVTIYQNVTLGAARLGEGQKGLYPKIGSDVVIFAGAKIIGNITIGDGAIIGANAVVTKSIPANSSAVGIPAKVI